MHSASPQTLACKTACGKTLAAILLVLAGCKGTAGKATIDGGWLADTNAGSDDGDAAGADARATTDIPASEGGAADTRARTDSPGGDVLAADTKADAVGGATEIRVAGSPGTNGIFDPSPRSDDAGNLWMSYSAVSFSPHDLLLTEVRTRIALSSDGGASWSDVGVDPNRMAEADLQVPPGIWASWHFEVSSLLFDPYDADPSRRWKLLWHRMLYLELLGESVPSIPNGWIGLSTAPSPRGPWSAERKLFTGRDYDHKSDSFIGPAEAPLDILYPDHLGDCPAFTEPSMLAKADGITVSLQCASKPDRIIGLSCDRSFANCRYLGDFLGGSEATQFSSGGQALDGFAATEMVSVGGTDYLIVSPFEQQPGPDTYRGCLVFQIADLSAATLLRNAGAPTLVKRVSGTPGSFNGACGYDPRATGSGIIFSEYSSTAPSFRMFGSRMALP